MGPRSLSSKSVIKNNFDATKSISVKAIDDFFYKYEDILQTLVNKYPHKIKPKADELILPLIDNAETEDDYVAINESIKVLMAVADYTYEQFLADEKLDISEYENNSRMIFVDVDKPGPSKEYSDPRSYYQLYHSRCKSKEERRLAALLKIENNEIKKKENSSVETENISHVLTTSDAELVTIDLTKSDDSNEARTLEVYRTPMEQCKYDVIDKKIDADDFKELNNINAPRLGGHEEKGISAISTEIHKQLEQLSKLAGISSENIQEWVLELSMVTSLTEYEYYLEQLSGYIHRLKPNPTQVWNENPSGVRTYKRKADIEVYREYTHKLKKTQIRATSYPVLNNEHTPRKAMLCTKKIDDKKVETQVNNEAEIEKAKAKIARLSGVTLVPISCPTQENVEYEMLPRELFAKRYSHIFDELISELTPSLELEELVAFIDDAETEEDFDYINSRIETIMFDNGFNFDDNNDLTSEVAIRKETKLTPNFKHLILK